VIPSHHGNNAGDLNGGALVNAFTNIQNLVGGTERIPSASRLLHHQSTGIDGGTGAGANTWTTAADQHCDRRDPHG